MQPRVSTKTVVLALAIMMVWIDNFVDARPMHADIIPTYLQYLEEKEQVAAELEKWLKVYGPNGTKKGFMPVTESRSGDQKEDLQQRLFMTKNQIKKAQKANPHAVLGTQGPFTLMTMEEFHEFLSNSHVAQAHKPEPPLSKNTSTKSSNNGDFDNEDVENEETSPTKRLPATTASTPIAATRLLRNVEKSDLTFDVGDNNEEMGFESIADSETPHQSQKPYQRSSATAINRNWNFEDVSTGDKAQIAHSTSISSETPPSGISRYQRTEPCSGNDCQAPVTQALIYSMLTPASPALAPASVPVEESSMAVRDSDSDSIDWSTSVCVSDPGLQGQCSSDWAFATVAALEAAQCIYNGNKKAPTYSKQQLVSCDKKNFGCNGGAPVYAMEYVRDNGICLESSYEYTSKEGGQAAACLTSCTPTKSGITEIGAIESGDESALLSVVKQQPVIVSVISSNPAWKQYISGVITACPTAEVDHAVLVVGYDAHTIKIKNSWGTDWGENGYVRISRSSQNMGTCAVLTDMSYPIL
ncbi:hypothetical protein DD237_005013 [Peronospora effusa]|uniref:Peptidase C1A papain C-terminal domain-containing protein n=1 Tax=Peronospora effusa TaxID=542832 RepID=A0A3R7YAT9_9STRA|nr:hypothetical protein DD237_005013 [Peronospora effusa]